MGIDFTGSICGRMVVILQRFKIVDKNKRKGEAFTKGNFVYHKEEVSFSICGYI